ncbi:hypothetical protein M409DRAFT_23816 [Zasmidium cellare ATCC 36951]|uniref:Enoyl reductase (ER) domain-containing protein n=1 Tax=Zasmidium cellare ATCC 36951 TaxID=1080233 RepID=A0A6A6CK51_ZASCE|nr:uncharacterized protein M409DRAFT_23816 [Zasmidium cellare ATCC 36951]KAF2166089.1 hypothetical protein M409DRAFT_23816 [Zasmidium cellare ATCC 36951]
MSTTIPKTMRALKCFGPKDVRVVDDAPVPACPPDYMLVKVEAIALNPTDWPFTPGDRVAGYVHGSKHEDPSAGCFAQYAKVKADIQIHVPSNIDFEEAATWPTGINTVGQGMYSPDGLELPWPASSPSAEGRGTKVLIYGASTNTGLWAVQLAKLSGLYVLATCSERNFEAVKALGADEVFDYRDGVACGRKIREATGDGLVFAFDCVSEGDSMAICAAALTSKPNVARYGALLPVEFPRSDVKTSFTIGYTVIGEEFTFFGKKVPAKPEDFEFGKKWWALAEKLLAEGKIKGEPTIGEGGLNGVVKGFEDMKEGRVSRQKLVYRIGDTL